MEQAAIRLFNRNGQGVLMPQCYQASAPGSLMIIGEHAVLWGSLCLVAAVDQRLTVQLKPSSDSLIVIRSPLYPDEYIAMTPFTNPAATDVKLVNYNHKFVVATLLYYRAYLVLSKSCGLDLSFTSTIHDQKGFGSSAAVVAATQAVILQYCQLELSLLEKVQQARTIVHMVQGRGSGADVAAAIHGGIIAYLAEPMTIKPVEALLDLTVLFSGHKTPTAQVIDHVDHYLQQHPGLQNHLLRAADKLAHQTVTALERDDLTTTGYLFDRYADLMIQMDVEDQACHQALTWLRVQKNIMGAKISGSGLGDCVIGCGRPVDPVELPLSLAQQKMQIIDITLTKQGVRDESC